MAAEPREDARKAIRDPIHGLISRRPKEISLMNTGVFQRLRRIRQLAMAHLVYPGALHTRFEHCVGTMHVASEIYKRLGEFVETNEDEAQIVRLAALLHDIGHGPFSHVSEFVLERHYEGEALGDLGSRGKIHERITVQLIAGNAEIATVLSEEERESVVKLLEDPPKRDFKHDIISSSLDADKMDYLLRDSYFAGVQYGRFDLEKIIDACRVHREGGGESYLALHHEGIYALEQLAMAKYHMGQQVYFHRIRAITDAMLVRGLTIAIREGDAVASALFRYDDSPQFLERYLGYDDDGLLRALMNSEQPKVQDLFRRLLERRLFKRICELRLDEIQHAVARNRLARLEPESAEAAALEKAIGDSLGIDPDLVIVNRWSVAKPAFGGASDRLDPDEILIMDWDNTPRKVREFPGLSIDFKAIADSPQTIQVYAPRDDWNDPEAETAGEREECQHTVQEIIIQHAS
jgi:HD superfamily phosphohydrolase